MPQAIWLLDLSSVNRSLLHRTYSRSQSTLVTRSPSLTSYLRKREERASSHSSHRYPRSQHRTSWSKRILAKAHRHRNLLPNSPQHTAIYGRFRSQLLLAPTRGTSCSNTSLSLQHFTSGGEDTCLFLALTISILIVDRTLAGIAALAFLHYRVCRAFWSTESSCSLRTHYFLFAFQCSLMAMMGYTYYLKTKLMEERRRLSVERKRSLDGTIKICDLGT